MKKECKVSCGTKGLCSMLLMIFLVLLPENVYSSSFGGLSVSTYGGLELTSLSVNGLIDRNNSIALTLTSWFDARGREPLINIYFYKGESIPVSLGNATVVVDLIMYYVPGGGKNVEWGSYFRRFNVYPKIYTDEILYQIDLREQVNDVLSYFSTTVSNLTAEDVGFAGRFSVKTEFSNATSISSDNGYLRFIPSFDGNMTSVTLDFTIPEEYDLTSAKLGEQDMIKIFPNRVQRSFSVMSSQKKTSELYMEWKIPAPPPPTPWYDQPPWRLIVPAILGVFVGVIVRDVIGRFIWKYLKSLTGRSKSKIPKNTGQRLNKEPEL